MIHFLLFQQRNTKKSWRGSGRESERSPTMILTPMVFLFFSPFLFFFSLPFFFSPFFLSSLPFFSSLFLFRTSTSNSYPPLGDLLRFLVSRQFNYDATEEKLANDYKWRQETNPEKFIDMVSFFSSYLFSFFSINFFSFLFFSFLFFSFLFFSFFPLFSFLTFIRK